MPVVVLTGGDPVVPGLRHHLPTDAQVVAADSGLHLADVLGLTVDVVVGDFDSVSPRRLAKAEAAGARIERHPAAKDATDLELALSAAMRFAPDRILVVGGHGGRLDHFLGNALLLASDAYADMRIDAFMGDAHVHVVRTDTELAGDPGELVSLLPVHGPARGVTATGLVYPLDGEDLPSGSTRGVSNEFVSTTAHVSLTAGVLLAVAPGALGTADVHRPRAPGADS